MGPSGRIGYILHILDCLGHDMQVLYLGRAPRTKETLPDFLKWRRVTRPPLVFRGLTGSQRTPGFWGVTIYFIGYLFFIYLEFHNICKILILVCFLYIFLGGDDLFVSYGYASIYEEDIHVHDEGINFYN